VQCREAVERRDRLIEHLASLDPVPGVLDQIVQHFGSEQVAEVTGRSRRIVAKVDSAGDRRLAVESRAGSANLAETQAFQDDEKRILVFSDAGGTGRSYHADLGARNRRLRVHYLLEAGWKADTAIQGLGRTNRTNQAQPPLFRPIATDVKAEKRFLSTIARRLDTLGAITKGQRQTAPGPVPSRGQPGERLRARGAAAALRAALRGQARGLLAEALPGGHGPGAHRPRRHAQGGAAADQPVPQPAAGAHHRPAEHAVRGVRDAAGGEDRGGHRVRHLRCRRRDHRGGVAQDRRAAHDLHPSGHRRGNAGVHRTGAATQVFTIARRDRNEPLPLADALELGAKRGCRLLLNGKSHRAAVQVPAPSVMVDDGAVERRVRLVRPLDPPSIAVEALPATAWRPTDPGAFAVAWEVAQLPEFREGTLHVVTGLLLPIWRQLPSDGCRVYRLQTDDGECVIGRQVSPAWVAAACATVPEPSSEDAMAGLVRGRMILHLADGMQLRRARVMHAHRIELIGFTDAMRGRLTAYGLFHEIIAWKLRMFVPTDERGIEVLAKVLERCPLQRVAEREGA
jgi:hypothetical protein